MTGSETISSSWLYWIRCGESRGSKSGKWLPLALPLPPLPLSPSWLWLNFDRISPICIVGFFLCWKWSFADGRRQLPVGGGKRAKVNPLDAPHPPKSACDLWFSRWGRWERRWIFRLMIAPMIILGWTFSPDDHIRMMIFWFHWMWFDSLCISFFWLIKLLYIVI